MSDITDAWEDVGGKLEALGLKLKLHAEQELSRENTAFKDGVDAITSSVKQAFDAVGDAFDDEAVRDDARAAADSLKEAIEASFRAGRSGTG